MPGTGAPCGPRPAQGSTGCHRSAGWPRIDRSERASVGAPTRLCNSPREDAMLGSMQTVCEATGGADGLVFLASAWHARVMADEVVSHAFSHGYRPDHTERLAAYWGEALGGP